MMDIRPFSDASFGAEIAGIDLARLEDDSSWRALEDAFLAHHVLSFRDQQLSVEQVLAASRRFGPLEAHVMSQYHHPQTPLVIVLSNRADGVRPRGLKDAGSFWHSDVSYKAAPARATLLYALEVPGQGGDTLFCDLTQAYGELPAALKARIAGRFAVHDYAKRDRIAAAQGGIAALSEEQRRRTPPVRHPVVRRHPLTGRDALYINPAYTVEIEGYGAAESEALMAQIFAHCLQPQYRARYKWRAGDVVLWDNAALMHAATTRDLDPARHRTLWRTIISGAPTH